MTMICSIIFPLSSFMGIILLLVDGNKELGYTGEAPNIEILWWEPDKGYHRQTAHENVASLFPHFTWPVVFPHTPPICPCVHLTHVQKERRILNVHHPRIIKKCRPHDDNIVNNGIQLSTFTRNDQQTTAHYRQNSELKSSNVILHHKRVRWQWPPQGVE